MTTGAKLIVTEPIDVVDEMPVGLTVTPEPCVTLVDPTLSLKTKQLEIQLPCP